MHRIEIQVRIRTTMLQRTPTQIIRPTRTHYDIISVGQGGGPPG